VNQSNEDRAAQKPSAQQVRKLYRSESEMKIAGVCGGLAEHFETDPTLMRAIMIVLALCGPGLLLYPVLWVMVPKRPEALTSGGDAVGNPPGGTSITYSPA
jgi:phage shock protein PspC (stress-responsive transcriptional regulator)